MRLHHIALAALGSALALAACGGSSKATSPSKSPSNKPTSKYSAAAVDSGLAFSECMRSHRVPSFPDPNATSGFQVQVSGYHSTVRQGPVPGVNEKSPAFSAAQIACQKLLPGGAAAPGQQHASAAAMALARAAARCMRAHGVPNFPDPGTFMPSTPPADTALDNINGAVFLIPDSIDLQAPAVQHAVTACKFPGGL
ncbi:MAG: hypothetical protein ACRET2_06220 [Steroidobacteraceae bacterium]